MARNSSSKSRVVLIALGVLCLVIFLASRAGHFVTAPLRAGVRPLADTAALWSQSWRARGAAYNELLRERNALREEAVRLSALARDTLVCREENDELRALAGYNPGRNYSTVAAHVLSRTGVGGTRMLIDQGADQGVRVGAAVIVGEGVMVGKVISVEGEFSEIALIPDEQTSVAARIAGKDFDGILKRNLRGELVLDLVPSHAVVAAGEMILTTGLDARVPRDLVLGSIVDVGRTEGAPFLNLKVAPVLPRALPVVIFVVVQKES